MIRTHRRRHRYGGLFYGHGASDLMLEVVRKRQTPVIDGGAGIWSFTEVTDAAAWAEKYQAG